MDDENKTEIEDTDKIKCVANIFLAQGGDGFTTFTETSFEVIMNDLDAFEQYITELSKKDNNGDGTIGLNKVDVVKNPNMINLDQNFDGIVDEPQEKPEEKPEEDKDETPDSGEEKPEEDKDETPDSGEEKPEEDKDETSDSDSDKEDDNTVNSPQTGEASVISYSVLGIIAAAVLSLINRRKIK